MPAGLIESTRAARVKRVAGLYAVTPDLADTDALARKVAAALAGGASVIQYRNKAADRALRTQQATTLARLVSHHRALFIVNDDADIAAEVNADGVHVGDEDADITVARARVGAERLVGASCYDDFDGAVSAVANGADYVAFGSFFPSGTKPGARRANRALLVRGRSLGVPVVAIGGITSANAKSLIDAGANAIAVIADVFTREDPQEIRRAAAALAALCSREPTSRDSAPGPG